MKSTATTEAKRALISGAAVKMFARKGYHGTRIADIAREAGVSYGLVYHYFQSKEEIVTFLFQSKWDLLVGVIENIRREEPDFERQIEGVIGFLIESYRMNPELTEALVMEITRNSKFIRGPNLKLLEKALDLLAEIVETARGAGRTGPGVDSRIAAYAFFGAIEAIITGLVFKSIPDDDETIESIKRSLTELFLRGVAATPNAAHP